MAKGIRHCGSCGKSLDYLEKRQSYKLLIKHGIFARAYWACTSQCVARIIDNKELPVKVTFIKRPKDEKVCDSSPLPAGNGGRRDCKPQDIHG